VVTAGRRIQKLQDVPASIIAETGADLDHRGATQLQDIINNTPGLSNPSPGPSNFSNLTIRGVTTGASNGLKQNTVEQFYDDIPLDPGFGGSTNLRLVDVQRIEVLRGPQGTLFGSGSLAGAIRYVTNKPDVRTFSGTAEVTIADTETGSGSYNANAAVNLPLIEDKLALRVVGYGYEDGGYVDDLLTGKKDINKTDTYGGRATLRFKPIERLTADLTVMYQNSQDGASADSLYVKPANAGFSGQVTDGISEPRYFGVNSIYALNLQYDLDPVSLISQTVYHIRKFGQPGTDYYFLPLATIIHQVLTNTGTVVYGPDYGTYFINAKNFSQEFRASSRGTGPLKWTVGGFYLDSEDDTSQEDHAPLAIPQLGGDDIVDLVSRGHQQEIAAFGEATYTLFNQLDLTAGVRVSQEQLKFKTTTGGYVPLYTVSPAAFYTSNFSEKDTPVNPHFSIDWRIDPAISVYIAAARGFRVGGVNLTSGVGGRASPPTYHPDTLWNYETGVKGKLFEGKFTYSADFYYIDWTNIQVNLSNNLGNYTGNAGRAKLSGFEGQFDARPWEWLDFGASLNVSSNHVNEDTAGLSTATGVIDVKKGDLLPASPESQAALYAQYNFKVAGYSAYVRTNANYTGVEYTSFAKMGTRFGDYEQADIRAGIHINQFELIGFVNNIFDSQGKQSAAEASSFGPVIISNQVAFRLRPTTAGVTLRAAF
jgi:outer membrane receptor protein involved in Fe transport